MHQTIALLTDFGLTDPYVGQLKGTILRYAPDARIVDLGHDIAPYALEQAAFYLRVSFSYFPKGTVFTAVIDPGVGGTRRIICLNAFGYHFLAPDNGVLGLIFGDDPGATAYEMTSRYWGAVCPTFHGRDLFAPMSANLSIGESPETMGHTVPIASLKTLHNAEPQLNGEFLTLRVLHVDHFGNVILNAPTDPWMAIFKKQRTIALRSPTAIALKIVDSYCELHDGSVGLLPGSQGYLELAQNQYAASSYLGCAVGDELVFGPGDFSL